jgi:cobalt-zinc-cadmium efflux system membrane fusion protein
MSLRVTVPNPDRLLKPEMFAIISVLAASSPDVLSVPLAAVQDGPSGTMVFVQREPGTFEPRPIKLGNEEGDVIRVLDGVKAGEQVVTKGSFALKSEMERHKIEPSL